MAESDATPSSGLPDKIEELNFFLDADRVYKELGSRRDCQRLIDGTPKLLFEQELEMRLKKHDAEPKNCKVYIFDDYLIIGTERLRKRKKDKAQVGNDDSTGMTTASSSDPNVVYFGSDTPTKKTSEPPKKAVDNDSDLSYAEMALELSREREQAEIKEERKYNLKMWVDLGKVKPRITQTNERWGIFILFRAKHQVEIEPGVFGYEVVVDEAQMWIDDENMAKTVLGIIQDAVDKKARDQILQVQKARAERAKRIEEEEKEKAAGQQSDSDTDASLTLPRSEPLGRSGTSLVSKGKKSSGTVQSGQSTAKERRRNRRRKFLEKREEMLLIQAKYAMRDSEKIDIGITSKTFGERRRKRMMFDTKIESDQKGVAEYDEGLVAEFTVNFKNSKLGMSISSIRGIRPLVSKLAEDGLAAASGVIHGDRVICINETEVTVDHSWEDCVNIIKEEQKKGHLRITFRRRQKNELKRIEKEKQQEEAIQAAKSEQVIPVDVEEKVEDTPTIGKAKTLKIINDDVQLRRKTDLQANTVPKYTMRRGNKQRKFMRKHLFNKAINGNALVSGNLKNYQREKRKMFKLHTYCEDLFATMTEYSETKEEKRCIGSLKEIYDTEFRYNINLGHIRTLQQELSSAKKNVMCKDVKSASPFCEHKRPRRYCTQESKQREYAIDPKIVNSIFLNLKPIIKFNFMLWKTIQERVGKLYRRWEKTQVKVEVPEVLEAFCTSFNEIAPFFQIYWTYCQRYSSAMEQQRILRVENKYFYDIVVPIEEQIRMKLPNLLARPLHRITRYPLCFKNLEEYVRKFIAIEEQNGAKFEIINSLKTAHKELADSHVKLAKLAQKVNDKIGEANSDQMLQVYQEIGGKGKVEKLLEAHRRFKSKNPILYEQGKARKIENNGYFYLFNDKLVVAVKRPTALAQTKTMLSYPLKAMKKLGAKATSLNSTFSQDTTRPRKKKSAKKKTLIGKKMSLRLSNDTKTNRNRSGKGTSKKLSLGSKDSKSSLSHYYDVSLQVSLRNVANVIKQEKTLEEVEYFVLKVIYAIKSKEATEISEFYSYFADEKVRDKVYDTLEQAREEDRVKREQMLKIRHERLGTKTRKFAVNHAKNKKSSALNAKAKAKESMFSQRSKTQA